MTDLCFMRLRRNADSPPEPARFQGRLIVGTPEQLRNATITDTRGNTTHLFPAHVQPLPLPTDPGETVHVDDVIAAFQATAEQVDAAR